MLNQIIRKVRQSQKNLNFALKLFRLADNPDDTMRVFEMENMMHDMVNDTNPENEKMLVAAMRTNPEIDRMLNERYFPPKYKVEDLAHYPVGTLGYAYYRHMHDNGFTPDFFPTLETDRDFNYFVLRMRQTHDVWHVLTGFGVDIAAETGLQAVYSAQLNSPLAAAIMSAVLVYTLKHPETTQDVMYAVAQGNEIGRAAKLFAAEKWETMWERSLDEIRQEFNIKPFSHLYDFKPELVAA